MQLSTTRSKCSSINDDVSSACFAVHCGSWLWISAGIEDRTRSTGATGGPVLRDRQWVVPDVRGTFAPIGCVCSARNIVGMSTQMSPTRILIGVDGSESSIDALRRGAVIAAALNAPLEAIMTWDYPSIMAGYYPAAEWSPESDARQTLEDAVTKAFPGNRPSGLTLTLRMGPPSRTLIEESKNAAMLVLGSRGHGGFVGLLLGSVSATCAEHAHCPVLIMHLPQEQTAPRADADMEPRKP